MYQVPRNPGYYPWPSNIAESLIAVLDPQAETKEMSVAEKYQQQYNRIWEGGHRTSPMIMACELGKLEDVKLFVNTAPQKLELINTADYNNCGMRWTPLDTAAARGHSQIVKYLLDEGVDITHIDEVEGFTALHSASHFHNYECVKMILEKMPKHLINLVTVEEDHCTALDEVFCIKPRNQNIVNHQNLVKLLKEYGAKANNYDSNGIFVGTDQGELTNDC